MTLKIERICGKRRTRIRLSGELRSEHLDQVTAEIERGGPRITLDLEEVDLVDVEGVRFLNACEAEGILVLRCSLYIREWMLRERGSAKNKRTRGRLAGGRRWKVGIERCRRLHTLYTRNAVFESPRAEGVDPLLARLRSRVIMSLATLKSYSAHLSPGKDGIVLFRSRASEGWRMEIGTIGAGAFAQAFAKQALKAGHKIKLSNSRGRDSLREIVNQLGPGATAASKEEAAACEMVLLAVPWDNVPETLASLPEWNNQVLIDGVNTLHGKAGEFTLADVGNLSASQFIAALAPGARVVKALNTISVPKLEADPIVNGARRVVFVSGDDDGAKKQVGTLLAGFGYSVIDLGSLRDGGLIHQVGGPFVMRNLLEEESVKNEGH